jgi:hypothetical protein
MRVSMPRTAHLAIVSGLCAATLVLAGPASAERPATRAEFAAINHYFVSTERTLHDRLAWVKVSTRGPFALAFLSGPQIAAVVLRGSGDRWRAIDTISDEGLKCGLVPRAVIADLHLERYNEGPRPCEE